MKAPGAEFEAAVDAIVAGDSTTLRQLLRNSRLVRERSTHSHHAMLLHYVGANGVEDFRQKTPKNAVEITELLLQAGAEVDAIAEMYGGATTLGLVATSVHPFKAGVQNELLDALLKHGADIDHRQGAGNQQCPLNGALANGRPEAAEFLASRGARLDLEGASGVGRLDVVKSFFNAGGTLGPDANDAQMKSGFNWACAYGRTSVVEFLLKTGFDFSQIHRGETGLHWAAFGGHADIVKLLLEHNARIDLRDERFHGSPLGWALYAWGASESGPKKVHYYDVVALLISAGANLDPAWLNEAERGFPLGQKIRADSRMHSLLSAHLKP